jgi:hypothetical protein
MGLAAMSEVRVMHSISAEESMAEPERQTNETPNYEDTRRPENPPNFLFSEPVRVRLLYSYLGTLAILLILVTLGFTYWTLRHSSVSDQQARERVVGTSGDVYPDSHPGTTGDELRFRGVDSPPQGPMPALSDRTPITKVEDIVKKPSDMTGRAVDVDNVVVERTKGDAFWVGDGSGSVQVVAAPGITLKPGVRVRVIGVVETADSTVRVRASKVETR